MRKFFKPQLLILLTLALVLAGCSNLRIIFSPNPIIITDDTDEIVGTVTLSGEGIGSVRVDTITATAFLKDGKIYDQRSITVNRSLPSLFSRLKVSKEVRIPIKDNTVPRDIDRIVIEVTGSDPGTLVVYVEVRD